MGFFFVHITKPKPYDCFGKIIEVALDLTVCKANMVIKK